MDGTPQFGLSEALRSGRLSEFIAQEEARGIGAADPHALDALVAEVAWFGRECDRWSFWFRPMKQVSALAATVTDLKYSLTLHERPD